MDDLLGCDGELAQSAWCVERARALDARTKIEAILATLAAVEQPPWRPADLAAANALYDEGVALFRDEYFGEAARKLEHALAELESIQGRLEDHAANAAANVQRAAPSPRATDDLLGCDGEMAQSAWCVERARALDARAKIEAILPLLAEVEQPPWPPADLAAANALYDEGAALFRDEYFGDAALKLEPALAQLESIRGWFEEHVENTAAAAGERLEAEAFAEALAGFRQVLVWKPGHDAAIRGATLAETRQRAQQTAEEALRLLRDGESERARDLLAGVPVDTPPSLLRKARTELADFDRRNRRNVLITTGHTALDRRDWVAATEAFRKALDLDQQSAAARDGLEQARRGATASAIAVLRQTLTALLAQESWAEAVATIRQLAVHAPDAAEVRVRLPELERLVALEARLDSALADPRRVAAKAHRADTRALIAETGDAGEVGQRIHGKGLELERQFADWTGPVAVSIRSDNRTEILIRPGRKLGKLREAHLNVFPGRYTLLGRRPGFREKKVELSIQPGSAPIVVELVCDERF